MPSYTVLSQSNKQRLLRTNPDGTAHGVTSLTDPAAAKALAAALTEATTDLPHLLVDYVLDQTAAWDLSVHDWHQSGDDTCWTQLPAPTTPYDVRRAVLNVFDHGQPTTAARPDGTHPNQLWTIDPVRAAVAGQPPSVVRAVRDELAAAYAPYTGVPVFAVAYDYKYGEVREMFLANAGLPLLKERDLAELLTEPASANPALLDVLSAAGLADFSYADGSAMNGYLVVDVHAAQLHAWHTAHLTAG